MSFKNVSKRYGETKVLSDVSLSLPRGIVGLVGPNGAGKSTFMKVILGFTAFEGDVRVLGLDPRTQAAELRARIGYMPERDGLPTGMSAVELCALGGELSGLPRGAALERAHATLGFVGLGDKRYALTDGYSTGMRQRVRLALALVHGPSLLLLDEPTNGLDPAGRDEMLALVAEIPRRAETSVLLSSHLLPDIESVCDQALVLEAGQVRYAGTLAQLRGDDHGPRRYEVRCKQDQDRLADALALLGWSVTKGASSFVCGAPDAKASTRPIFDSARALGVQVRQLEPARRGLEAALLETLSKAAS
ncbi:MAG: ABC transporter ATP-binding protein [Polyangia bacterium]